MYEGISMRQLKKFTAETSESIKVWNSTRSFLEDCRKNELKEVYLVQIILKFIHIFHNIHFPEFFADTLYVQSAERILKSPAKQEYYTHPSKMKGERKLFSDKQKSRKFITCRFVVQEMLMRMC